MDAFLRVVRDLALLVASIVTGVTLMAHGWRRWTITGLEEQSNILEGVGLPSAQGIVIATIAFELLGGALLIFGLATPLIGLGIIVQNLAVILTTRSETGFYQHEGGWEYNAILASVGVLFLAFGSGRAGLDHLFLRPKDDKTAKLIEDPDARRTVRRPPTSYPEAPPAYPNEPAAAPDAPNHPATRTGSTRVPADDTQIIERP